MSGIGAITGKYGYGIEIHAIDKTSATFAAIERRIDRLRAKLAGLNLGGFGSGGGGFSGGVAGGSAVGGGGRSQSAAEAAAAQAAATIRVRYWQMRSISHGPSLLRHDPTSHGMIRYGSNLIEMQRRGNTLLPMYEGPRRIGYDKSSYAMAMAGQARGRLGMNPLDVLGREYAGAGAAYAQRMQSIQAKALATAKAKADFDKITLRNESVASKLRLDQMRVFSGALSRLGGIAYSVGKRIALLGGVAYHAFGQRQFKSAMGESSRLREIMTLANTPASIFGTEEKYLRGKTYSMSSKYGLQMQDTTKAVYDLVSAGFELRDSLNITDAAAKLAIGSLSSMEQAGGGVITMLHAFGLSSEHANKMASELFSTVKLGRTTMGELSEQIGRGAAIMHAAGIKSHEYLGAIATLTRAGLDSGEAVTAARAMSKAVLDQQATALRVSKEIGLNFNYRALQEKGLMGFLGDVMEKTGGNMELVAKLFERNEARIAVAILGMQKYEEMGMLIDEVSGSVNAHEEAYSKIADTLQFQFKRAVVGSINVVKMLFQETQGPLVGAFKRVGDIAMQIIDISGGGAINTSRLKELSDSMADALKGAFYAIWGSKQAIAIRKSLLGGIVNIISSKEFIDSLSSAFLQSISQAVSIAMENIFGGFWRKVAFVSGFTLGTVAGAAGGPVVAAKAGLAGGALALGIQSEVSRYAQSRYKTTASPTFAQSQNAENLNHYLTSIVLSMELDGRKISGTTLRALGQVASKMRASGAMAPGNASTGGTGPVAVQVY